VSARTAPAPLVVAASLVVVEAMVLLLVGVAELVSLTGGRLTMGLTTAFFFVAAGAGLLACGWGLSRSRAWGRGPVLVGQVMAFIGAWQVRGDFTFVAVVLAVAATLVLAGILHPQSMQALEGGAEDR
jgi:hypothetical protein